MPVSSLRRPLRNTALIAGMRRLFRVARIWVGYYITGARSHRSAALSFCFSNDLEICHWNQTSGTGGEWVTGLVPVGVVLSADDMKEVALVEAQLVRVTGIWMVVVKRLDHLQKRTRWISTMRDFDLEVSLVHRLRLFVVTHTFFGGWMAMADLGVMELCRLGCLEVSFSPLIERRMALSRSESARRLPHLRK